MRRGINLSPAAWVALERLAQERGIPQNRVIEALILEADARSK